MFESIMKFVKKMTKKEEQTLKSKNAAKERLHLVLMQDRANVSADFLDLMKQEIIEVIKKYIDIDESTMDVRLTNKENGDGTNGAPALYANIPILNIKEETRKITQIETLKVETKQEEKQEQKEKQEEVKEEIKIEDKKETYNKEIKDKESEEKEEKKANIYNNNNTNKNMNKNNFHKKNKKNKGRR